MNPKYRRKIETFVRTGAELIRAPIQQRYPKGVPWNGVRPLEPGFIPLDDEAKFTAISWYPNDGDLRGKVDYDALRENFARWGRDGTVGSYRIAYEDWLASLEAIPFYLKHTRPVIERLGLTPRDIAWIPLIKVPMRPRAEPDPEVIELDRDDTWKQVHMLHPDVVLIQGITTTEKWIGTQVREQITTRVATQDIGDQKGPIERQRVIDRVVAKLAGYISR